MTEFTIRGDRELIAKLNKLQPRKQKVAMKAMGLHLVGKMKVYPARSFYGASGTGKQAYVRTRNLAKKWDVRAKQQEALVQNFMQYAPYVQGDDTQFHFHRATGWQTLRKTAEKESEAMVKLLKKNIDRILEGR